jgi:uncharacterized protein (TIGR04255 family)
LPNYKKPPVKEALFSFRVLPSQTLSAKQLIDICAGIKNEFSEQQVIQNIEGQITFDAEKGALTSAPGKSTLVGYMLRNRKAETAVQIKTNEFSFHKLAPYTGWENIEKDVIKYFDYYVKQTKPREVSRIGIKFLNQITIPESKFDLADYFELKVAAPIQDCAIEAFLNRQQLVLQGDNRKAIVTLASNKDPAIAGSSFIFEIDVFSEKISLLPSSKNVWETVNELRTSRNTIFEASLTPKTKSMFEPR